MASRFRKSPPVCLGISIIRLIFGRLRYSQRYLGSTVKMPDGQEYTIFRHITAAPIEKKETTSVFIVRFKFARLSRKANKLISKIPMLLITSYPGFNTKIYALNAESGYWQGMYEWKSRRALDDYKESLVLGVMNKRAIKSSVSYLEFENHQLYDFIDKNITSDESGKNP